MPTFLLAVTPNEVFEAGEKLGTANNQVILGVLLVVMILCVVALGAVIAILHRINQRTIATFIEKLDVKENAMTTERVRRIDMLMGLLREDVAAKKDVAHAMEQNSTAIRELKEFMKEDLKDFIREVVERAASRA
jgi:hypothetical protein